MPIVCPVGESSRNTICWPEFSETLACREPAPEPKLTSYDTEAPFQLNVEPENVAVVELLELDEDDEELDDEEDVAGGGVAGVEGVGEACTVELPVEGALGEPHAVELLHCE